MSLAPQKVGIRLRLVEIRTMNQTLDAIRRVGLTALRQKLGRAGMIRFLHQFGQGSGDFAKDRHSWVDRTSMPHLRKLAARAHSGRGRKR